MKILVSMFISVTVLYFYGQHDILYILLFRNILWLLLSLCVGLFACESMLSLCVCVLKLHRIDNEIINEIDIHG